MDTFEYSIFFPENKQ